MLIYLALLELKGSAHVQESEAINQSDDYSLTPFTLVIYLVSYLDKLQIKTYIICCCVRHLGENEKRRQTQKKDLDNDLFFYN